LALLSRLVCIEILCTEIITHIGDKVKVDIARGAIPCLDIKYNNSILQESTICISNSRVGVRSVNYDSIIDKIILPVELK